MNKTHQHVPPCSSGESLSWVTVREAGEDRLRAGHPWIFRGHVRDERSPAPGTLVGLRNARGKTLAWGFWSAGALCFRALVFGETPPCISDVLRQRLRDALAWRKRWSGHRDAFRWVHGEGDGLSGLVVDVYGDVASVQLLTSGWSQRRQLVVDALRDTFPLCGVVLRNDGRHLEREGLVFERSVLWGKIPEEGFQQVRIGRVKERIALLGGQKTGIYLDVQNVPDVLSPALADARMLDVFCFQGHFALHALLDGAREVVAVEQSAEALEQARRNRELNGLPDRVSWLEGNAFDILRQLESQRQRFHVVVMDPPPFAPGKDRREGARRGYKELALRAFRLLEDEGTLLFLCCSHAFTPADLLETLGEAARDAGVTCRIAREIVQPADHPASPHIPESRYFSGFLLGVSREFSPSRSEKTTR